MNTIIREMLCIFLLSTVSVFAQTEFEKDVIQTSAGNLEITFIGHGTLMFSFGGKTLHVDPWGRAANYDNLPKADIVLITHHHGDHLDPAAVAKIRKADAEILVAPGCGGKVEKSVVLKDNESMTVKGIKIEGVPAYNIQNKRDDGQPYHVKGECLGFVITFGDKRVYIAGDTENTPEMKALKGIDIAFLPMNLPYTMTPEMVADAAKAFQPKILYPYHFGDTNTAKLVDLLKGEKSIEVRIRKLS